MKLFYEFKRYSIVGVFSTLINYFTFYIFLKISNLVVISSFIGYFIGLTNSYFFGKEWVFKSKIKNNFKIIFKFILVYSLGGLLNSITIYFLNKYGFVYYVSWLMGTLMAIMNNFYGSKFFVFTKN